VRAPVAADPGDDDVTRLGQERLDLVGGCHPPTLSGPPRGHRLDGLGVAPMSSVAPRRLTTVQATRPGGSAAGSKCFQPQGRR
jgi:hypothetical protein